MTNPEKKRNAASDPTITIGLIGLLPTDWRPAQKRAVALASKHYACEGGDDNTEVRTPRTDKFHHVNISELM